MKFRPLLLALLIVGGFYYATSVAHWNIGQFLRRTSQGWSTPGVANTAGFSTDEVSNIDIYKTAHLSTVNITSVVWREGWFFQLYPEKGTIAIGSDADLVVFDPDRKVTVTRELLHQNVDHTPYEGFSVTGWPAVTISRGEVVFENGQVVGRPGRGRFVKRGATTSV